MVNNQLEWNHVQAPVMFPGITDRTRKPSDMNKDDYMCDKIVYSPLNVINSSYGLSRVYRLNLINSRLYYTDYSVRGLLPCSIELKV